MGGGVFEIGNPEGRGGGARAVLEIQVEGRGVQKYAFHRGGGGGFFWNNPFNIFLFHLRYKRNGEQLNVSYWVTATLGTLNFILVCYTPISIKVAPVNHVS